LLIRLIKDLNTDLLGISIRSSSLKTAEEVVRRVRQELKNIKIIIGGTHAILSPEECIELADMVCLGEGEYPFLDVLRRFTEDLSETKNIPGLWVRVGGHIYKNGMNELIDIDNLPPIDYSGNYKWYIENDLVLEGDPLSANSVGEIFSSRGCPYKCTYCTNNILKSIMNDKKFVRLKNVDNVIGDIINLKRYFKNLKKIVFADEVFAFNKQWTAEFCAKYKEKINLPFAALFYPNMVTEETVRMLKDAGLTHGRVGLQSGSERIRKDLYKRNHSNDKTVELTNIFHRVGIRLTFDIIVNNPYETEVDLRETLRFYLQIPKPFELNMHSLVYFPKTDLTNMALKDGIIRKEHVEGEADEALRLNHVLLRDKKMIYGYKNNLFWNCLFSLTSKPFIPSWLTNGLSRNRFLRNNPSCLLYFAKVVNIINIAFIGLRLLKDREIGIKDVFQVLKSFSFASSVNK
ncbi:radical SAM protein, partial [bacterium]